MIFNRKKTLSMDFNSRNIKMVVGTFKKNKLNISDTFLMDLPDGVYEDGHIKDLNLLHELTDSFLRLNDIKKGDTTIVVNSTDILTREIELPSVSSQELEGIIKYKINDYIPIDVDDYVIQYIDQGIFMEDGNEKMRLFIMAMPKDIVVSHLKFLRNLDLKPKRLDYKSNALRKLIKCNNINSDKVSVENKTIAIVDIGFSNTELSIFKDEKIEIARVVPLGIKNIISEVNSDLTEEEIVNEILNEENTLGLIEIDKVVDDFLRELFESLDMVFRYYKSSEADNDIDLIFIQGNLVKLDRVREMFEEYLSIETQNINSLDETLTGELYLYSNAIGSLIRGEEL